MGNKVFTAEPFDYVTSEGVGAGIAQFDPESSTPTDEIASPDKIHLIRAFPNPARDYFNIDLPRDITHGFLELFDPRGRLISVYPLASRFQTAGLTAGLYLFRVRSGNRFVGGNKLVVE